MLTQRLTDLCPPMTNGNDSSYNLQIKIEQKVKQKSDNLDFIETLTETLTFVFLMELRSSS